MSNHAAFDPRLIDVVLILLGLGLVAVLTMVLLGKALLAGVFPKPEAPEKEEDILDIAMEEGDICPCGLGILELKFLAGNPEEVRLGKYILVCAHCKREIRSD